MFLNELPSTFSMTYYVSRLLLAFFALLFGLSEYSPERTLALASKATGQKENPLLHTVCYFLKKVLCTGKSFSEALILESVNPRYDERWFIEFPEKYKFRTCCVKIFF